MQKGQKKVQKGMVGRQSVPIQFKWAAMVSTLRTTALKHSRAGLLSARATLKTNFIYAGQCKAKSWYLIHPKQTKLTVHFLKKNILRESKKM